MLKIHKTEIRIALTAIVALLILFFIFKFLRGISLFEKQDTYYILFDNAKGLAKSSPVYADGYNVGIVSDLYYDYEHPANGIVVEIAVEHGMRIPEGTTASLDEAMLGGCTLNLLMGNNPMQRFELGDTIPSVNHNGLMGTVGEVMPQLEAAIAHADSLLLSLNRLVQDTSLMRTLNNVAALTERLNTSAQDLNVLLEKDIPALAATYTQTGKNIEELTARLNRIDLEGTMAKVDGTLAELQTATAKFNSTDNTVGLLLNDTTLYRNLNNTTSSATLLLEDLKAHPKRYVHFSIFGKKDK